MFCPRCASKQSEDVKFCTGCGANLGAVRQVVDTRDSEKRFDWSDTWVADMFMSGEAAERRKLEMERRLGITPEVKRYNEIKTGVILSSVGIGLMVFLFFFMRGIAGSVDRDAVEIITRVWMSGLIPFFVGVAFMINGAFISKKLVEIQNRNQSAETNQLKSEAVPRTLRSADTNEFIPTSFTSVTESTTRHLSETANKQ
jgi:hypothetical protein